MGYECAVTPSWKKVLFLDYGSANLVGHISEVPQSSNLLFPPSSKPRLTHLWPMTVIRNFPRLASLKQWINTVPSDDVRQSLLRDYLEMPLVR